MAAPMKPYPNDTGPFGAYAPGALVASIIARTRRASLSWAGRRGAYALRKLGLRLLAGRPVDTEALGARMRLYPYNNVCEKRILFTPQYFDEPERALLAAAMKPGFIFIDIGANIGGYTLFVAATAGRDARILAIEPQPEIFERLVYNIRQNEFASVKALDCAVSDKDAEITLFLPTHNRGETSMRIVNSDASGQQLRVMGRTLLGLVQDEGYNHIDAIKLDVEGAEDLILETFYRTAPKALWPKLVLMEYSNGRWAIDLPRIMRTNGYRETLRTKSNVAWVLD
ncbi:FkbM family methyltransferase [Beijerinckia sp. 28-YEA-48]|uniref:FkbM family methyltransferase n=2 Tax=unclassified Beijerinckia TaxID=2638183 RepID=UPI00089979CC|nr:FkbM family methyltransferase [Beijerinckia sp. 28-YEA-48]MDH7799466.1 FkbM family methyltransferase [Beijerinckia sp. GAS462]SED51448.1 methyltransferase, FkbM family [Beijerinckia sp. 28-YEA-48]